MLAHRRGVRSHSLWTSCSLVLFGAACSSAVVQDPATASRHEIISESPALRFVVRDSVAVPGFLFARPRISSMPGAVAVTATQYGSLCRNEVTAGVDISPPAITLTVKFAERLTLCTGEIRKLVYDAEIRGLAPGTYDVTVVHAANGTVGPVSQAKVVVDS